jgi:hypothetical protein
MIEGVSPEEPLCRRCSRPVRSVRFASPTAAISATDYETFEGMHYVCFHYEFEHDPADPDEECTAGGCPSGALAGGRGTVAATARQLAIEAGNEVGWENDDLPSFLEAFGAWLDDCGGYYANDQRVLPSNAWSIVADALRAASTYE